MRPTGLKSIILALALLSASTPAAAAVLPIGVSPGSADRFIALRDPCPTFSWSAVPGAEAYELVVFEVDPGRTGVSQIALADHLDGDSPPLLLKEIPGAALSWTPAADQCLRRGGRYAWLVRASAGSQVTDWSKPRWLELAPPPTVEEVEEALETLRAFLREGRGPGDDALTGDDLHQALAANPGALPPAGRGGSETSTRPGTRDAPVGFEVGITSQPTDAGSGSIGVYGATDSVVDGSVGILGEAEAATGVVDGVQGVTSSVAGTGVRGLSQAQTGINVGVQGGATSPEGFGGFFFNFGVDGVGTWTFGGGGSAADLVLGGNLLPFGLGFDDGRIHSDPRYLSSDIVITSNDDVVVELDGDGDGEDSDFTIKDKDGMAVFNVDRTGTTLIEGDLFLIGEPQGGLVSISEVQQLIDAHVATEHPKLVFVTATTYRGDLGGTTGADQKCQARAAAGGLQGTFKAWISGDNPNGEEARDRLNQADVNYRRLDGVKVADNWGDLTDGTLDAPIRINEFGNNVVSSLTAYTNTDSDGSRHAIDRECGPSTGIGADWNSSGGTDSGGYGSVSSTSSSWSWSTNNACTFFRRLYCFEQ